MVQDSFGRVIDLARVMRGFRHDWFISGGWAIDMFLGRVTREHEDVEVGAYLAHQGDLRRHLAAWELRRIRHDVWEPWADGDSIELPEFQAQARSERIAPHEFDIFFNPLDADDWVSRRHANLRVPTSAVTARTIAGPGLPAGIPYLVPEIQLLYKAKYHRPKDDADFDAALGHLSAAQRAWLRATLDVHHPGDPWTRRL